VIQKKKFTVSSRMDISGLSEHQSYTPGLWALQLPFYLEAYGTFYANERYFTERTGLRNHLLIYTMRGRGMIRTDGESVEVGEGDLTVIDCMKYQYYKTVSHDGWDFMWLHFYGTSADLYCKLLNEDAIAVIQAGSDSDIPVWIRGLFDAADRRQPGADLTISESLVRILSQAIRLRHSTITAPRYGHHFKDITQALDIIHHDFQQKLSIDALSEHTHMSKYHFLRVFKSCTGQTPYEYLMSYRVGEAKKLLHDSDLPVAEIACRCGFSDASNFIRCFRRACGTTPKIFRKDRAFRT
jgi:AraC-like DNA-binding protein